MLVKVNGEGVELPDGSTVRDAIESSGAPYIEGCVLGVIKGKEEIERHVNKYSIKTNKGSIIIELMNEIFIEQNINKLKDNLNNY